MKTSLLKELSNIPVNIPVNSPTDLKNSDSTDAGKNDVLNKVNAKDVGFSLMRNTINSDGEVTGSDVANYIERAEELNDEVDTIPFGLETDDGQIVKVYVNAAEADRFEEAMKGMLGIEDDIEEAINRLASDFDIVDVVWPRDPNAAPADGEAPNPDDDLNIDDLSDLLGNDFDTEDDEDFADDQYDVIAAQAAQEKDDADVGADTDNDEPSDDEDDPDAEPKEDDESDGDDEDNEDESDEESDDESEDDVESEDKPKKKKKAKSEDDEVKESIKTQEHSMSIGKKFLERMNEAAEDTDGINDGFNIPLDSQARALSSKLKFPLAKRLVAFFVMSGIPGRYLNSEEAESGIAGAADMLRKRVAVRRAFVELYEGLANAKGFNIPAETANESIKSKKINEAAKRGSFIQKLLESVLIELGLPGSLVSTSGPSAVGTAVYVTAETIEQDSTLERLLRVLASRLGISASEANSQIGEAIDVGNDDFSTAIVELISALGIDDDVLQRRRPQVIQQLRAKKGTLRNRAQIITLANRLKDLVGRNTIPSGSQADNANDTEQ
jgi:hypothetical protein